jgi:Pyridoxamine 5'-phosphate oxidase
MPHQLSDVAPTFIEMAHRIVWATVATVDPAGRPWTRVLHPIWIWDGEQLVGWVATMPTPTKRRHLDAHPHVALTYWHPSQDTANAYCAAALHTDDDSRSWLWEQFLTAPAPVGYDPKIIPFWSEGPLSPDFAALRLEPWRLYVQPAAVMMQGAREQVREWRAPAT